MKKVMIIMTKLLTVLAFNTIYSAPGQDMPLSSSTPYDSVAFNNSKLQIQSNYDEMYHALPVDIQNKIKSARATIENIRLKTPADAQAYVTTEQDRLELLARSTISQMQVSDAVKAQIDNARKEIFQRINDRIIELKQRRLASQ